MFEMFASNVVEYKLEEVKADYHNSPNLIRPLGVTAWGLIFYVYIDRIEHMFYNFYKMNRKGII